jgi:NigD-like C-terminal beta sandwich domain
MKAPLLPLLVCLSMAMVIGCKPRQPKPPTVTEVPEVPTPTPPEPGCPPLTRSDRPGESNPISGLTSNMAGDCLEMKVTYSGGCKPHQFQLVWNGAHAESMPPQINLELVHNNGDDHCRELKSEKLSFDLKSARYSGVGQVIVNLTANGVPLQRANYTY